MNRVIYHTKKYYSKADCKYPTDKSLQIQSVVLVPARVLGWNFGPSGRLGNDDLINPQDSDGSLRGQSDCPFFGLAVIVNVEG